MRREDRYLQLIKMCDGLPPLTTAVVHPCSDDALKGAIEAAERDLIAPILIGPEKKIRAIAADAGIDLTAYRIVPTEHSHHAAEVAVRMVRSGDAETLMKGSLHTDELLHEVMKKDGGLRTERRLSHCFVMAVPTLRARRHRQRRRHQYYADVGRKSRHRAERHRIGARRRCRSAEGGDPLRRGDGDAEDPLDHRRGRVVQDGRPRPDQGRTGRRSARLR